MRERVISTLENVAAYAPIRIAAVLHTPQYT